jgi:hypothetical protein
LVCSSSDGDLRQRSNNETLRQNFIPAAIPGVEDARAIPDLVDLVWELEFVRVENGLAAVDESADLLTNFSPAFNLACVHPHQRNPP